MNRKQFCIGALSGLLGFSVTAGAESGIPKCGVQSAMQDPKRRKSKWGKNTLSYFMAGRDTRELDRLVWDDEFRLAFDAWSEITPLIFHRVRIRQRADIVIDVSRKEEEGFGERGGILAWAEMPPKPNYNGQLITKFDIAEFWVLPERRFRGTILRSVAAHEIGHLLGLDHSEDENALMFPYINNALKPREDDIIKIQQLYGSNTIDG